MAEAEVDRLLVAEVVVEVDSGMADAAATQRIAEYLGEGRAALLDRARGAEAETHALAARCARVAAALEGGDDAARRAGAERAQRAGDQVATKTLAKARARLLLLHGADALRGLSAQQPLLHAPHRTVSRYSARSPRR